MQQSSSYTIVVGLNPALQKRFILSSKTPYLVPGNVHRASVIEEGIGGKGQDVYVALHCLSSFRSENDHQTNNKLNDNNSGLRKNNRISAVHHVKLVQFLGKGVEGDTVLSYFVDRYEKDFDLSLTIRNEEKLRICTTIVESEDYETGQAKKPKIIMSVGSTELIEPSGTINQHEIEELRHAVKSLKIGTAGSSKDEDAIINGICFMGTMPPGCPTSLYAEIYRSIISKLTSSDNTNCCNVPLCLIDSVIGLDHLFHEMNVYRDVSKKTNMIKINMAELCMITGTKTEKIHDIANAEIDQVRKAMKALYIMYPESRGALSFVAITNGMFPAFMVHVGNDQSIADNKTTDDVIYRFSIPKLSPINTKMGDGNYDIAFRGTDKLYTIGAGDAVTACTLAAWEYLTNRKSDQKLDESIRASLLKNVVFGEDIANTAFSFGLACGTASCIEKDNSVFNIPYALHLFQTMERPKRI
jgi:fructose-1-phosphate kinase PfkB-like protein